MNNLNPKMLYWIFLAISIISLVSAFWFNVFFNPLLAVLFFVALNFSFFPVLFFVLSYGIFFDIISGVPFGQYAISFMMLCAIIFIFKKFFALKNNAAIFLPCSVTSLVLYVLSLYVWGMFFGVSSGVLWPSLSVVIQKNTLNLAANFILILPIYIMYFFRKSDLS